MKKCWKLMYLVLFGLSLTIVGCGTPGGAEGDENDPAAVTDEEQMEDETGEI